MALASLLPALSLSPHCVLASTGARRRPRPPGPNPSSQSLLLPHVSPRWNLGHRQRDLKEFRITAESPTKSEPMIPPYNVLITGSTKGLSFSHIPPKFLGPIFSFLLLFNLCNMPRNWICTC